MLCLRATTDPSWAPHAALDLTSLLVDHAHCEMKAASNALALAARHPTRNRLVRALAELAREEVQHFQRVMELLDARGVELGEPRVDVYAAELRRRAAQVPREVTLGRTVHAPLVDRLLVAALIEARSCERFKLMIAALRDEADASDVVALYEELFPAEARHYRLFVDLAVEEVGDAALVDRRLRALADVEGELCRWLGHAPLAQRATVHG